MESNGVGLITNKSAGEGLPDMKRSRACNAVACLIEETGDKKT